MYRFLYAAHGLFPLFLLSILLALPLLLQAGEGHDLPVLLFHLLPLLLLPVLPCLLELTDVLLRLLALVHLPLQLSATPQTVSWKWQEWVLHRSQHHGNGRNGFYTAASIMATAGMGFTPQSASWQQQEWVLHCSQHHGNGRNGFYTAASIMATAGMGFTLQPASWQRQEWVLHRNQHHGNGRNGFFIQLTMMAISEKMATSWVRIYGTRGHGKRTVENKDMNSW